MYLRAFKIAVSNLRVELSEYGDDIFRNESLHVFPSVDRFQATKSSPLRIAGETVITASFDVDRGQVEMEWSTLNTARVD